MDGMKEFPTEEGSVRVVCPGDSDYSGDGGGDDGSSKHRHTHCCRLTTHVCAQRRRCLGEINNNAVWNIENGNAAHRSWTMLEMKRRKKPRGEAQEFATWPRGRETLFIAIPPPSFQYFPFLRIQPTPWGLFPSHSPLLRHPTDNGHNERAAPSPAICIHWPSVAPDLSGCEKEQEEDSAQ
ncbi:hypothetical protein E2C01_095675 [Portunus trituberculatus]|uniref:Uncharacterized protein n=1 Tax=Portunus trituberculatus TaxID=210409 RepID=A0A5B7K6D4_PORTR|nr:hypothetical protein [Portunus trituberculatus]